MQVVSRARHKGPKLFQHASRSIESTAVEPGNKNVHIMLSPLTSFELHVRFVCFSCTAEFIDLCSAKKIMAIKSTQTLSWAVAGERPSTASERAAK